MQLKGKLVDDVEVDGVDRNDHPDYCDAYFSSGTFVDGTPLTDDELADLAEKYPEELNERANEIAQY